MTGPTRNLPASVAARLLNRAKQTGDVYQTLLTSFCFERFLYRLGVSDARERFVLKGAMLLRLWSDQPYRATRDLDLLRKGDGAFDAIRSDVRAICAAKVEPDAVVFDTDSIQIEAIRAEDKYSGTRVTLLGSVRPSAADATDRPGIGRRGVARPPHLRLSRAARLPVSAGTGVSA